MGKVPIRRTIVVAKPPPKLWDIERDGVTQSLLGMFLTCQEKTRLRVLEGLSSQRVSGPLAFGSLFHEGLDKIYGSAKSLRDSKGKLVTQIDSNLHVMVKQAIESLYKRDKARMASTLSDVATAQAFELNFGLAEIMLYEYFRRWDADLADLKWVDLERTFNVPYKLRMDYGYRGLESYEHFDIPVRGKFDGVFLDRKGKHWLFETKTKSLIDDSSIADKLGYELQVMLYLWAMRHTYDVKPAGVVYNLVRRPLLKQKQTEDLPQFLARVAEDVRSRQDFYFIRYNASIAWEEVEAWLPELDGMIRQLYAWSQGDFHYRNSQECNGRYGVCEFLPLCSGTGVKEWYTRRTEVFPELAMVGESEAE